MLHRRPWDVTRFGDRIGYDPIGVLCCSLIYELGKLVHNVPLVLTSIPITTVMSDSGNTNCKTASICYINYLK